MHWRQQLSPLGALNCTCKNCINYLFQTGRQAAENVNCGNSLSKLETIFPLREGERCRISTVVSFPDLSSSAYIQYNASNTESDPHWSWFGSGPKTRSYPAHVVHYIWLHWNGFIQYPCDIISSLPGCLVPTAAAEEVLNRCTMKKPKMDETDPDFKVAFNYEFIEDIQDKYVILYFCLIHTTFRTS